MTQLKGIEDRYFMLGLKAGFALGMGFALVLLIALVVTSR